jgi:hypothetical protein
MEISPSSEAASCALTQEFLNTLCKPKVHYRVQKSPPIVPILSQINSVHTVVSYPYKIHFKIILPHTYRYFLWSLSSSIPAKILYALLCPPTRATCPAHLIGPYMIVLIILLKSISYEAPHYVFLSNLLSPDPSKNVVALVRNRTTPTEGPLLVGEVSAKFCG